jgi:hypothetical protein
MDFLLRRILRAGMRRGLGGQWSWLVLAGAAYVLRRALNDSGGPVSTVKISPGEQVLISVRDAGQPQLSTAAVVVGVGAADGSVE